MKADSVGATSAAGGAEDYILIQEQQVSGTNGGTFTAGARQTRVLNTEVSDSGGHASVAGNQITLAAGTWRVKACAPAYRVNRHKAYLYNVTDAVDLVVGLSMYAASSSEGYDLASVIGEFTIAASKVIELQHECQTNSATLGLGVAGSFGAIEIYSTVEFWKRT